jgi:NADPH-dependent F420 reductase
MGSALAARLAKSNEVRIGSRRREKAEAAAAALPGVRGELGEQAARWCEAAIVSVPYEAIGALEGFAESLAGKLVISIINPLRREGNVLQYGTEGRSAAELVASALPRSFVATAFNNVPLAFFRKPSSQEVDILVAADSRETFEKAATLVRSIPGLRPLYVGPLTQAESVERITVLVLNAAKLNGGPRFTIKFVS